MDDKDLIQATEDPRPLTPDAITDEMIERGADKFRSLPTAMAATDRVRCILTAALTEPPARPDGAEQFDAIVDSAIRGHSDITDPAVVRAISNALAEDMHAALTEPPARPEGAEELGELIGTWTASEDIAPAQLPTGSLATLADFLAERGVRAARRDEEKR